MNYQIEALTKKNINDLVFLYKAVFGKKVTLEFVLKKYDTSYLINKYFGHIAYLNGKPIAFHGAIPVKMKYKNKFEIAAQSCDSMTLNQYAGKGLFTELAMLTYTELEKENVSFIWGFPNQNSKHVFFNKLNWQCVELMQGFKIKTSKFPFEKFCNNAKIANVIYQKYLQKNLKKYQVDQSLKGSVFKNKSIVSTYRNSNYYNYKSFTNNFVIKIENVFFWIKIKNGLLVGDIEMNDKKDFFYALEKLKKIAIKIGVYEIVFQTSPKTEISQLLLEINAEKFESWCVGYKNFNSNFPLEKLKFTFGDLDTF